MTRLSMTERAALCDTALQVGADGPTLCEGWTVKDLVVHLLVRERRPAAVGIVVAPLAGLTARSSARIARTDFPVLVERLRGGPPPLSPFRVPRVDALANTLEYLVHHEDVRRAVDGWAPRRLGDDTERLLWTSLRPMARRLVRRAPVGVRIEDTLSGSTAELRRGDSSVTLRGLPSELALYLFGRTAHARVDAEGREEDVARLGGAALGI